MVFFNLMHFDPDEFVAPESPQDRYDGGRIEAGIVSCIYCWRPLLVRKDDEHADCGMHLN
jgi:hypothetical protein